LALFTIGDTHLSIADDSKSMDLFAGWQDYVQRLKKQWNSLVKDDDIVVVAGDISWSMKLDECFEDFNFLNNLNGSKIFLKGNHDLWWSSKTKIDKYLKDNEFDRIKLLYNNSYAYKDYNICGTRGWMFVEFGEDKENVEKIISREVGRLRLSLKSGDNGKENIVFLHYPPIYNNYIIEEIIDVLVEYDVKQCYYGHIHAKGCEFSFNGVYRGIKFNLISADYVKFTPHFITK